MIGNDLLFIYCPIFGLIFWDLSVPQKPVYEFQRFLLRTRKPIPCFGKVSVVRKTP